MDYTFKKAMNAVGSIRSSIKSIIDSTLNITRTSSVGIIQSFDAEAQTAVIQPAIKKFTYTDYGKTYTLTPASHALLVNVPVQFPGGGDWHMTFPVSNGDECILIYAERSLDNWKKYGSEQEQSNFTRRHSMKDAIAIVGVHSQPSVISDYNSSFPEIRNSDASIKLTFSDAGMELTGDLTVSGSVSVTEDIDVTGDYTSTAGSITTTTGEVSAKTVGLSTHTHTTVGTVTSSAEATTGTTASPTVGT